MPITSHPSTRRQRSPWRSALAPSSRVRALGAGLLVALGALSCSSATTARPSASSAAVAARDVFPGTEWERVPSAAAAGWSQADLDSVRARISTLPTTGFVAVVGGRVLFEYGDLTAQSYLASIRKSVLSMLYGIAQEKGEVHLDRTLAENGIDDVGGLTAEEKQATTRDLLGARSGVYHEASNGGDDLASAPPRGSQKHGTYQLYSNWDFNVLGTIYEKETGRNIYDDVESRIARPIGMQDWDRSLQRKNGDSTKSIHPAYHMLFTTRDMARIGYLMLREGRWKDRQVVPRDWVHESTRPVTRVWEMHPVRRQTEGPFGYGYLWWVWDGQWAQGPYEGAYTGLGAVGQQISVLPKLDLVVVHKTAPRPGSRGVTHPQYLEVLDMLVKARCPDGRCP
jgi:CubicO group peptidase (beta-lactamase class C family)